MDIPFESFANLVFRLGHPPQSKSSQTAIPPAKIFTSWLNHLQRPLPPNSGKHIFRLLFPHEGSRRRYGLKETKLAAELERILCLDGLRRWDAVGWGESGTGCLGKQVERVMKERVASGTKSNLTLVELDWHLDNLAAHSSFAQLSQEPSGLIPQSQTLTVLFRDSSLSLYAMGLLVQIILRDLRPLLSPVPSMRVSNPTAMLRLKTTIGPAQLDLIPAMRCWDPRMAELYRCGMGDIDACATAIEHHSGPSCPSRGGPVVGVNVQIPKCLKGRSVEDALKEFAGKATGPPAKSVWAETKYDGYRMQIHVHVRSQDDVQVTIFSKSKRNSTSDRLNTHAVILSALGLPVPSHLPSHSALWARMPRRSHTLRQSVILEAEVVPYNENQREGGRGPGVEEFWWLGAAGVTAGPLAPARRVEDHGRHSCLFFFDILHLDGQSLLQTPLRRRRQILEETISVIPGFSELASYTEITLSLGRHSALDSLQYAFHSCQQRREEGLVLKAPDSTYLDYRWRWVKLKKDYIPNLGDCVDLVLLGAGWDIDRARELRVDTSVFTTFYIGTLSNLAQVKARVETPHFDILFRVSYGPDRDALESINGNIRHGRWATKPFDKDDPLKRRLLGLSWTYRMPLGMTPPSVLFERPLCAEVMGAGFQKIPGLPHYELRWPRLQKIWEYTERPWTEALGSAALLQTAHHSLGYVVSPSENLSPRDDSIRALWRSSSGIALTDIPDFPTPSPEGGAGRSPLRAGSLGVKSSPHTSSPRKGPMRPMRVGRKLFSTGDILDHTTRGSEGEKNGACLAGPLLPPVSPVSGKAKSAVLSRALLSKKAVRAKDAVTRPKSVKLKPLSLKSRVKRALKGKR